MTVGRIGLAILMLLPCGCKEKPTDLDASLHRAVAKLDLKQVDALVAHGANVNAKDGYGWTPLHVAARIGHPRIVELLISHGADVDANDGHFGMPLHYATWEGHGAIVRKLIAAGANVNATGANVNLRGLQDRSTPLQLAFARYHSEVAGLLLAAGADPNVRDEWGRAVLHDAALKGLANFAQVLLAHGAQVNVRDTEGLTPLHEAAWENHLEMVRLLLAHGADVNARDIRGQTALHVAAINGHKGLFDVLAEGRAEVDIKDVQGRTAFDYMRLPTASWVVTLRADGKNAYSVILTNPSTVREFLRRESILYDQVWIPGREDIEGLDLRAAIEKSTRIDTKTSFSRDYVLSHLSGYNREYGGFIKQGKKYVLCNMDFNEFDREPG